MGRLRGQAGGLRDGESIVVVFSLYSEDVRSVPEKVTKFKASKHYLQATELLKNSGKVDMMEVMGDMEG